MLWQYCDIIQHLNKVDGVVQPFSSPEATLLMVRSKGARPTRTRMWVNLPGSLQQKCKCVGGNRMRKTRHSWPQFDMDWCPLKQQQEWWIYNFSPPFHDRPQKRWIMVHQRNQRIHSGSGFFSSFDAQWSKRSGNDLFSKETQNPFLVSFRFKNPILDFHKETHLKSIYWLSQFMGYEQS